MGKLSVVQKESDHQESDHLFFGGLPTTIELNKLKDTFPVTEMKPGDFFPYHDIEDVLGLKWRSNRFRTVTTRWRNTVRKESNIVLNPVAGKGFKVLMENEKMTLSFKKIEASRRVARKALDIGSRVDRKELTDAERKDLDIIVGCAAKLRLAAQVKQQLSLPQLV